MEKIILKLFLICEDQNQSMECFFSVSRMIGNNFIISGFIVCFIVLMILFIYFREREWEGERKRNIDARDEYRSVASHTWQGTEPAT